MGLTAEEATAWLRQRDATTESVFAAYHNGREGGWVFHLGDTRQLGQLLLTIIAAMQAMEMHVKETLSRPPGSALH